MYPFRINYYCNILYLPCCTYRGPVEVWAVLPRLDYISVPKRYGLQLPRLLSVQIRIYAGFCGILRFVNNTTNTSVIKHALVPNGWVGGWLGGVVVGGGGGGRGAKAKVHSTFWVVGGVGGVGWVVVVVVGGRRQSCIVPSGRYVGWAGWVGWWCGDGRGAKAKVTFWVVSGVGVVGGWWVVGGGLGKVGWVVSVWVQSVGLSWAGFVDLSSVGWVSESGVRGHHRIIWHIYLH